ncbi:23635_t:CDS:2, partial [Dentiscutata erythropus]
PLLWLRQFNRTYPTWIAQYFQQYESSNMTKQHKTFFSNLELAILQQSRATVDPFGDCMDYSYSTDHIMFQLAANISRSEFKEAIDNCDVYNYSDICKFVLTKINWKLADPHINVLYSEIDMTIEHICPRSTAQPLGVLTLQSSVREKLYDQKYSKFRESSFAITQHLCKTFPKSFSSEDVEKRHALLVDTF